MKTLIADDIAEDRKHLRYNLERRDCEVIEAKDGWEGLALAVIHKPDLIISDAFMPGMDGFQFLREVKKSETLKTIPFLFYSAVYTEYGAEELALSLGADAFIMKPEGPDEFWDELSAILKKCGIKQTTLPKMELIEEEDEYLKKYGHIVTTKLEEKVKELADEINRRGQMEKMLRDSEEKFKTIFENAMDGILLADSESKKFTMGNRTISHMLGYTGEEIKELGVMDVHPAGDLPSVVETFEGPARGESSVGRDIPVKRKDGSVFYADINVSSIILEGKKYLLGMFRDVTERKKAEEELAEMTQTLQSVVKASPLAIIVVDADGRVFIWNSAAEQIFGWSEQEAIGRLNPIVPEEKRDEFRTFRGRVLKGESFTALEVQRLRKDGSLIDVSLSTAPIYDAKGKVIGILGILGDITERKRMVEQIFQISQEWEDTFNSITDMVTIHDKDFNVIHANKAAQKMLGLPLLEMTQASKCFKYYHGSDNPPEGCPSCDCLRTGVAATFELFEPHLNMFIEIRAIPRFDSNNDLIGLIHVVRDITERKTAEEYIKRQFDRMTALRSIDMAISSTLDLRVSLHILLEQIVTQLKADAADVLLLDSHTMFLNFAAGRGFRSKAVEKTHIRVGQGLAGRAALQYKTISIPNLAEGGETLTPALKNEGFRAYFAVPLIAKGQMKGVLEIFSRSLPEPDPEWLNFLELLGGHAAIAVDNVSLFDTLQRSHAELVMAYDTTIEGWSRALDYRDKETEGHSRRVTDMTVRIAKAMAMHDDELVHIRRGALLHDIGKLGVPDPILLKPGKLTDEEWVIMKRHPEIAFELLSPISFLRSAIDIPYCHHEKWDGTGYPRGLRGEQIPIAARIFAIVDVWDALLSDRPYRPAWTEERAFEHIRTSAGSHFDPEVVEVFLKFLKKS